MNRAVDNVTDVIANPFRTLRACARTLAILGLGLMSLSPASAQHQKSQSLRPGKPISAPSPQAPLPSMQKSGAPDELEPFEEGLTALKPTQLPPAVIPPLKAIQHPHVNRGNIKIEPLTDTITLPTGRKVSLSRMRRQFAPQENLLNSHGSSLFDPNAPSLELAPDLDYDRLEDQRDELVNHRINSHGSQTGDSQAKGPRFQGVGSYNRSYPWSWSAGDHNYFQISLNSYLYVYGDPNYLYAYADGRADGAVLGHDFNIADAYTSASSYQGNVYGSFVFKVVGDYVMNWSTQQAATWTWNWSWQKEVAEPYHVWLGPIPVGGRVGIRGSIGSSLSLGLYGSLVRGNVKPYVNTSGFAEAGVDIWFAGAGVGGSLTFLNCSFPNEAGSYFQWDGNGNLQLVNYVRSHLDVSTLSGNFYIWAQLFGSYDYWTLWNWSGITWSGDLWNDTQVNTL